MGSVVFQEILYSSIVDNAPTGFKQLLFLGSTGVTLKVIDSTCLREWWGKEGIRLVVKGKQMCLFGSRKSVPSL